MDNYGLDRQFRNWGDCSLLLPLGSRWRLLSVVIAYLSQVGKNHLTEERAEQGLALAGEQRQGAEVNPAVRTHVYAGDVSDRLKHALAEHMGHRPQTAERCVSFSVERFVVRVPKPVEKKAPKTAKASLIPSRVIERPNYPLLWSDSRKFLFSRLLLSVFFFFFLPLSPFSRACSVLCSSLRFLLTRRPRKKKNAPPIVTLENTSKMRTNKRTNKRSEKSPNSDAETELTREYLLALLVEVEKEKEEAKAEAAKEKKAKVEAVAETKAVVAETKAAEKREKEMALVLSGIGKDTSSLLPPWTHTRCIFSREEEEAGGD
jgi:hypothetical protein